MVDDFLRLLLGKNLRNLRGEYTLESAPLGRQQYAAIRAIPAWPDAVGLKARTPAYFAITGSPIFLVGCQASRAGQDV